MCAKEHSDATVVADDTDMFILLLFHYLNESLTCPMFMSSPIQQRSLIDIKQQPMRYPGVTLYLHTL